MGWAFADSTQDMKGCVGHAECSATMAQAIESSDLPEEVFCYEGLNKHLTGLHEPCEIHAPTTSGLRQVVINLVKLNVAIRKGSNRAV